MLYKKIHCAICRLFTLLQLPLDAPKDPKARPWTLHRFTRYAPAKMQVGSSCSNLRQEC